MNRLISCLLSALISAFSFTATATDGQLAADEAHAAAERGEILIIDVRTPAEWRETGIPKGAKAVEFGASDFLDRMVEAVASDRSRPVALICRSGNRSTRAVDTLRANGFLTSLISERECREVALVPVGSSVAYQFKQRGQNDFRDF